MLKDEIENNISDRLETLSNRFNIEYYILLSQYVARLNNLQRVNPYSNIDNKLKVKAYHGVIKYCEDKIK